MATKQKTKDEVTQAFVPSKGDEAYLQPAGSLEPTTPKYHGIDALSLQMLDALATDINKTMESAQKSLCRSQIKVGSLLNEARVMFPGDKEFGKWRSENTEIKSPQTAYNLMLVARKFSSAPKMLEACSYSALVELISAPEHLVKEIEAKVDEGKKPPTVAAIREKKSLPPTSGGKTSKAKTIYDKPERDKEAEAIDALHGSLEQRFNHKNPYVKLGLYPFGGPPNLDVLTAIEMWAEAKEVSGDITEDQLDKFYMAIHEVTKEIGK